MFAHRGGASLAPENTVAAFDRGLAAGADGLELDVQLSRDGIVVVHHDLRLERTTNARGLVAGLTARELARVDAGWHFGPAQDFPFRGAGIGVPTLAEVLARYPRTRLIIELKQPTAALARATVNAVHAAGAVERVCIGGFDRRGLAVVRSIAAEIATSAARIEVAGALLRNAFHLSAGKVAYRGFQVPERSGRLRIVTSRFVASARAGGRGVQVWTVNDPSDACRLLELGVDGLITDRPDLLVPLVQSRRGEDQDAG